MLNIVCCARTNKKGPKTMIRQLRPKKYFLALITLIFAMFIGSLALVLVYSLPSNLIQSNVKDSLTIYREEMEYFRWAPSYAGTQSDNWTDTLMLSIASYSPPTQGVYAFKDIIEDSLLNPHYKSKDTDSPVVSLFQLFWGGETYRQEYSRYWHGYLILLKPLLTILTMSDIRMCNMIIQLLLLFFLMICLYTKGGYRLSLPFLFGIIALNPINSALSLQLSSVYYITLLSCFVILKYNLYDSDKFWYFFFIIGICTSYFDLLSYPLVTLGFPLILYILLKDEHLFSKMKQVITASIYWGMGYAGMWVGKWTVASLVTGNNIFINAYNQIKFRINGNVSWTAITIANAIKSNLCVFNDIVFLLLYAIFLTIIGIIFPKKYTINPKKSIILPLLFVGIYPFVWVSLLKNHSIIHFWCTHRIFSITILSLIYSAVYLFSPEILPNKEPNDIKKDKQ